MATKSSDKFSYKSSRIKVTGEILKYDPCRSTKVGCFILSQRLGEKFNHFEIKIVEAGASGNSSVAIGLAPYDYPLDSKPGWRYGSVGFDADEGKLCANHTKDSLSTSGKPIGRHCEVGDRIGCGIRKAPGAAQTAADVMFGGPQCKLEVYFTINDVEIGTTTIVVPEDANGLHPVIGMSSAGESVQLTIIPGVSSSIDAAIDDFMLVDDSEDDWAKIHDVKINGQVIEYAGNGVNIHDVGVAQGKHPLSTRNHYFEIEIVEPGQHCYIAIGLIHKNYPLHRHPGWNAGSIAYHADDGKIFLGRGQGIPFGPRCNQGDVMGCGIQFPVDYVSRSIGSDDEEEDEADEDEPDQELDARIDALQDFDLAVPFLDEFISEAGSDDEFWESGDEDDFLWPQPGPPAWIPRMGDGGDIVPMDFPLLDDPVMRGGLFNRGRFPRGRGGARVSPHLIFPAIYGGKGKSFMVKVFFTRNGYMIGHEEVMMPKDGFFPAVGMLSAREKVKVDLHPLTGWFVIMSSQRYIYLLINI